MAAASNCRCGNDRSLIAALNSWCDVITTEPSGDISTGKSNELFGGNLRIGAVSYFVLTVLGFSFWFFMAVPFASHRETYWWLAKVRTESFSYSLTFISSTYRPLHQVATWLCYVLLDVGIFPTSVVRQTFFQLLVYAMFVLAWGLIYSGAAQRRTFAVIAAISGAVFFSGYVHLFHVYGIAYVPVMIMLGGLLHYHVSGTLAAHERWLAAIAAVLVLWHPFTTALFVGYYFGHYLETFRHRTGTQHLQAWAILIVGVAAVGALVVAVPRLWPNASPLLVETATRPADTRFLAFLVSYQTNEINRLAALVAFGLTLAAVVTLKVSPRTKVAALSGAMALTVVFFLNGVPLVLLWVCAAIVKLVFRRSWSLVFLALTAALLPFGGGIGTPIHALFAIIIATYATALDWDEAESVISRVPNAYVISAIAAVGLVVIMVRTGMRVPVVTNVAGTLLAERERTYQLEHVLEWLHGSDYCSYQVGFVEKANNPVDSVESAIERRNRPPAALGDVDLFWRTALQCRNAERPYGRSDVAVVTCGGPPVDAARAVFEVPGRYAGPATVWVHGQQK
jgi:hypothetical protein